MTSKLLAALSYVRRILFGFALAVISVKMGSPIALYVGLGYILFCLPLCFLGNTWQDRLSALLTGAGVGLILAIPALNSILS